MAKSKYKKLSRGSLFSVQSCYLGDDHLLIVDGRFQERTKQLKYSDIQAILICPTKTAMIFALIGALIGLVFLLIGLANLDSSEWIGWMIVSAICWSVFAYGIIGKGSALMGVQTAVQTVIFEDVTTLRKARKVDRLLTARIEELQGELSVEALREGIEVQGSQRAPVHPVSQPVAAPPPIEKELASPQVASETPLEMTETPDLPKIQERTD